MGKKQLIKLFRYSLLGLLLVFGMAACGNSNSEVSGEGQGGSSETGEEASESEDVDVVKIGAPYPLTGSWAAGGQNSLNGMMLAAEDINNSGGIEALGGAQIEIVSADTGDDPSSAAEVTNRLIERDNVSALVGAYVSALSLQATTEAEQGKVPIITQSFVDDLTERGYQFTFQIPPKSSEQGEKAIGYIAEMVEEQNVNVENVAFVANNDANSIAAIETSGRLAEQAGFNIVLNETFPPGIKDATPIVQQVKNTDPDIIFMAGVLNDEILVIRQLRSQGITTPIVGLGGGGILDKGFPEALGEHSDNVLSISAWNWDLEVEGLADINERYKEQFDYPFMPQEAGESYIAVWLIKEAIESAGSADPEIIAEQLAGVSFDSGVATMMVGGSIEFDEEGMNNVAVPLMIEYKDGLPYTVWPKQYQTMEPVLE